MSARIQHRRAAIASAIAALAVLAAQPVFAQKRAVVRGPIEDLHVTMPVDYLNGPCIGGGSYPTYMLPYAPYTNTWPNISDTAHWYCIGKYQEHTTYTARTISYVTAPKGDFGSGQLIVTNIYGQDLYPGEDELLVTGFTGGDPEFSVTDETWTGISKKVYKPFRSALVAIADLPATLGPGFDLSPFAQSDPTTVVYVFQGNMPASDMGSKGAGPLFSENFGQTYHQANGDFEGAYGPGTIAGTNLRVVNGDVDILGVANGTNGRCVANPAGNCLDLIGNAGYGTVQAIPVFDLDPNYVYTVQFTVVAQDVTDPLHFTVSLGQGQWDVVATAKPKKVQLTYTPAQFEALANLTFQSATDVDGVHGPVLSAIALCAHDIGSTSLNCPKP